MKAILRRLAAESKGAAIVEFALSASIILGFLIGITQIGILFMANAGLRHAVGEGARLATIFPTPTDATIIARVNDRKFGLKSAYTTGPTITRGTQNGASYIDVSMTYAVPLNFVFYSKPTVTLTATRRAFTS